MPNTQSIAGHPTVSPHKKLETEVSWCEHFEQLENEGVIRDADLRSWLYASVYRDNIGYEGCGKVRPDELGKWDLFFTLYQEWQVGLDVAAKIARLTTLEIADELEADRHIG